MESLKKIQTLCKDKNSKNKFLILGFIFLGAASLALSNPRQETSPQTHEAGPTPASVDTLIPNGYVLVPIEVSNANSLSSLLGDVGGVVDLYLPQGKKNSLKIASKLKILRAPYNPDLYAVLVREQEGSRIMSYSGPFLAVVQNPREKGQRMIDTQVKKISIDYQN